MRNKPPQIRRFRVDETTWQHIRVLAATYNIPMQYVVTVLLRRGINNLPEMELGQAVDLVVARQSYEDMLVRRSRKARQARRKAV